MAEITRGLIARVGVDLAKQAIQVHAVDAAGHRLVARAFKRDQFLAWCAQLPAGCVVAMEACSSAHPKFGISTTFLVRPNHSLNRTFCCGRPLAFISFSAKVHPPQNAG